MRLTSWKLDFFVLKTQISMTVKNKTKTISDINPNMLTPLTFYI